MSPFPDLPNYKFYPKSRLKMEGPNQWARYRLAQACQRLKIDLSKLPFDLIREPWGSAALKCPALPLPDFNVLLEYPSEWKEKASEAFEKHCIWFLAVCKQQQSVYAKVEVERRAGPKSDIAPIELRYE